MPLRLHIHALVFTVGLAVGGMLAFTLPIDSPPKATAAEIEKSIDTCRNAGGNIDTLHCWRDLAERLLTEDSFAGLVEKFENVDRDCHDLMHYIARLSYRDYNDIAKLYNESSFVCFGAAYHGGVEGFLETKKLAGASQEETREAMMRACTDLLPDVLDVLRNQCNHGLGHALMVITNGDLPASLQECKKLRNDISADLSCAGGVFMENLPTSQTNPHTARYIRDDNPFFPCDSIEERFQKTCYTFQISHFSDITDHHIPSIVELCLQIPQEFQTACVTNIGPTIFATHTDIRKIAEVCADMPSRSLVRACNNGVISAFFDRFAGIEKKLVGMFDFCDVVSPREKGACYDTAEKILWSVYRSDANKYGSLCRQHIPQEYQKTCKTNEHDE